MLVGRHSARVAPGPGHTEEEKRRREDITEDKNIEHKKCSIYISLLVTLVAGHCYSNRGLSLNCRNSTLERVLGSQPICGVYAQPDVGRAHHQSSYASVSSQAVRTRTGPPEVIIVVQSVGERD